MDIIAPINDKEDVENIDEEVEESYYGGFKYGEESNSDDRVNDSNAIHKTEEPSKNDTVLNRSEQNESSGDDE